MPEATQHLSIIPDLVSLQTVLYLQTLEGVMSLLFLASQKLRFPHKTQMKMVLVGYPVRKHVEC